MPGRDDADAGGVACVQRPVGCEIRDVVRRMAWRGKALEPDDVAADVLTRVVQRCEGLRDGSLPLLDPAPAGRYEVVSAAPPEHFEEAVARAVSRIGDGEFQKIVLAREDHAKEVKLFDLGPRLMSRYREIFRRIYEEERKLTLRRTGWGFALGLVSDAAFYGAYAWIAIETVRGAITLGEMTMYLTLFRQGQSAVAAMLFCFGITAMPPSFRINASLTFVMAVAAMHFLNISS